MHTPHNEKTLIIGIGNEFRGDDAAGLIVAQRLESLRLPEITIIEQTGDGVHLLEAWQDYEYVIIVDAVHGNAEPGALLWYDVHKEKLPAAFTSATSHAFGVAEAIELARVMNELPPRIVVFGIVGDRFDLHEGVSAVVERAIDRTVGRILNELEYDFQAA